MHAISVRRAALAVWAFIISPMVVFIGQGAAQPLDVDADECMIQRALLGDAAPGCPPRPAPPLRPAPSPAPPLIAPAVPPPVQLTPPTVFTPPPSPPSAAHSKPAAPIPPPVAAAHPHPTPPPAATERTADFLVLFDFASDKISPASEALLGRVAGVMNAPAAANLRFHIIGHTDGVGSAAANLALSARRAEAVKTWLGQKGGVALTRLEASGVGKTRPADPANPTAAANRRVEIVVKSMANAGSQIK